MAKMMDGSILIALRIVDSPIFPITTPLSSVTIMDCEATCWAILSDAAEAM